MSSWKDVAKWYDKLVSTDGHYYHKNVVMPNLLRLLDLKQKDRLVDLACGQGILSRLIPKGIDYLGIDIAKPLIEQAKAYSKEHTFLCHDLEKPLKETKTFSHGACILALQNMEHPEKMLATAAELIEPGGKCVIVLNHPCFRIPRQSGWGHEGHQMFRKINRYLSPLKIPIAAHPSQKESPISYSYHYALSTITRYLSKTGFIITSLEEWISDKKSTGKYAKMENLVREEFPLFLTLITEKRA